jgi:hypothetical protein
MKRSSLPVVAVTLLAAVGMGLLSQAPNTEPTPESCAISIR